MALALLASSDAGASARDKINAAIAETGKVGGKQDAFDLAGLLQTVSGLATQAALAAEGSARTKADADEIAARRAADDAEATARARGDADEAGARRAADDALKGIVDGKAGSAALSALAGQVSQKADRSALDPVNAALAGKASRASLDALALRSRGSDEKPADGIQGFTFATDPSELVGEANGLAPLSGTILGLNPSGAVVRITGPGIVARRELTPVEVGRVRAIRAVVSRFVNSPDPSNDTVRIGVVWLDQNKRFLGVGLAADIGDLTVASGRQVRFAHVGTAAGAGIDLVAPERTAYFREFTQYFGSGATTDLEILSSADITGQLLPPAASNTLVGDVAALMGQNAGERLGALESAQNAPNSITYATRNDATAGAIPATATTVVTRGQQTPGDGLGRLYKRVTGLPAGADGFTNGRDGSLWLRIDDFVFADVTEVDEPSVGEVLSKIYGRMVTAEQGGADPTGTFSSGTILSKLAAKTIKRGKVELNLPKGRFLLKEPLSALPDAGLVVRCHPQTVIVADYDLNTGPVRFSNPAANAANSTPGTIHWIGGIIDVRRLRNVGPNFPCDSLSLGENVQDCLIEGAVFIHSNVDDRDVEPLAQGLGRPAVTAGGSGYTTATVSVPAPDFRLPNGTAPVGARQATAAATIVNGGITAVRFTNNGRGYTKIPTLTIGGDGTGASAACSLVSDYRTAGGDSSISFVGSRCTARSCTFIGAVDCGIYPTARADGSFGDSFIVDGNFFIFCNNATVAKRGFQKLIHVNNIVTRCNTGFSGGIADVTRPSAREMIMVNNIFDRVVGSVAAFRQTNGGIFAHNLIKDFGFDLDDNRISGFAVRLEGASYTQVCDNTLRFEDVVSGGNHVAIRLTQYTQNGVTLHSTRNRVSGNILKGWVYGIVELDVNQDRNVYAYNDMDGVTVPYTILGPNSVIRQHTAEEHYLQTRTLRWRPLLNGAGFSACGRYESAEVIRTTTAALLNVMTIVVPAGQMMRLSVEFQANNDDGTAAYGSRLTGTFRRTAAGSLVQVGAAEASAVQNDFIGTPTVAFFTDVNAVRVRVQGLAGIPMNWFLETRYRFVGTNA